MQSLVEIGPVFMENSISSMHFRYFVMISPWERMWPFDHLNQLESSSPKEVLCKVFLIISPVVVEQKIFRQSIFAVSLLSPLRKGRGSLFEQTWIPSPKNALCQVWFKLALWLWDKSFEFRQCILYFVIISLGKQMCPSFEPPSPKDALCQSLVEIGTVILENRMKMS